MFNCPICHGNTLMVNYDTEKDKSMFKICTFCYGKQELDWIECLLGVDTKHIILKARQLGKTTITQEMLNNAMPNL